MAGRGRAQPRGRAAAAARGRARGGARKESGFGVSLRRAADKAAESAIASAVSTRAASSTPSAQTDVEDVTLIYRRPPRRQAASEASRVSTTRTAGGTRPSQDGAERHVHFGGTTVHTFDSEDAAPKTTGPLMATSPLQFWQRCAAASHLSQALRECAFKVVSSSPAAAGRTADGASAHETLPSLAELDSTRLCVAVEALLNVRRLLLCPHASAAHATSSEEASALAGLARQSTCWVSQTHAEAVVALVQLSEAAVPSHEPSLVSQDAAVMATNASVVGTWPAAGGASSSPALAVPSPVCATALTRRLTQLVRLCQLEDHYAHIMPQLRQCGNAAALTRLLLSHSDALLRCIHDLAVCEARAGLLSASSSVASLVTRATTLFDADTFLLLPGLTSRHRLEQAVLASLLKMVNVRDCALDVSSWGPMSMLSPLKITQGVYVVQQLARMHALECVLQEAEFYGLPTFLRSIRRPATARSHDHIQLGALGWYTATALNGTQATSTLESWLPVPLVPHEASSSPRGAQYAAAPSAWRRPAHQLFLGADVLDGERFTAPDPMQAPVVQEELISLCVRHCAYGLLIGEGDQVVRTLQQSAAHHTHVWQRRLQRAHAQIVNDAVKVEDSAAESRAEEVAAGKPVCPASVPPHQGHHTVVRDPLELYARRARALAREEARQTTLSDSTKDSGEPRCVSVDWLCPNRWSSDTDACYYGLLYGVVVEENNTSSVSSGLQTEEGSVLAGEEAVDPAAPLDVDGASTEALRPAERVTYYVAAVVELHR